MNEELEIDWNLFEASIPTFAAPQTPAGTHVNTLIPLDPVAERCAQRAGSRVAWKETRIGNWNGLADEARKLMEPDWWKIREPRDRTGREIFRLADGEDLEIIPYVGRERIVVGSFASQRKKKAARGLDANSLPNGYESIAQYFGRLGQSSTSPVLRRGRYPYSRLTRPGSKDTNPRQNSTRMF
jgi:hypothetical protein